MPLPASKAYPSLYSSHSRLFSKTYSESILNPSSMSFGLVSSISRSYVPSRTYFSFSTWRNLSRVAGSTSASQFLSHIPCSKCLTLCQELPLQSGCGSYYLHGGIIARNTSTRGMPRVRDSRVQREDDVLKSIYICMLREAVSSARLLSCSECWVCCLLPSEGIFAFLS